MATPEDLDETVALVEKSDRRALAVQADVRRQDELDLAVTSVIEGFGRIDGLVVNHGIWGVGQEVTSLHRWALAENPIGGTHRLRRAPSATRFQARKPRSMIRPCSCAIATRSGEYSGSAR
jgi:NAD(P)-dependent dehydrogenase (short-subunit alcohol dehydrogenase family)